MDDLELLERLKKLMVAASKTATLFHVLQISSWLVAVQALSS